MTALSPPDPPLDDGVVRLRALRAEDAAPYAAAFRDDPDLGFLAGVPDDPDEDAARRRILETGPEHAARGSAIELAIAASEDDRFLGAAMLWHVDWEALRGETGLWIAAGHRSSGVGSRALALLVGWSFDAYGLHRIHLETFPENTAMRRAAERTGFVHEGVLREHAVERGRRVSVAVYGLLAREWPAPPTSAAVDQAAPPREAQPMMMDRRRELTERLIKRSTSADGFDREALRDLQDPAFGVEDHS